MRPRRRVRLLASATALLTGLTFVATSVGGSSKSSAATAAGWDAGYIISDPVFYASGSMSVAQIDSFLRSKGSSCQGGAIPCLKNYRENTRTIASDSYCKAYTGRTGESAAQIIANVAASCGISPKVLIVTIEKESSLVSRINPTARNYETAMGFGCPDGAACDAQYYGFQNQVYRAARQFKIYAANPTRYNHQAGRANNILYNPNTACGSSSVYIRNQATASLYNYTPYQPNAAALANLYGTGNSCSAYGNRNFWRIFTDWFGDPRLGGYLIKSAGDSTVYLVVGSVKYTVPDWSTYLNYAPLGPIATVSDAQVNGYRTAGTLGRFARDASTGGVYLVNGGKKYHATSCGQVADFRGSCASLIDLDSTQWSLLADAGDLQSTINQSDGRSYYIGGGQRHEVFDNASLTAASLPVGRTALPVGSLEDLPITSPIVRNDVAIRARGATGTYVWSAGTLYPVPAESTTFAGMTRFPVGTLEPISLKTLRQASGTLGLVSRAGSGIALMTSSGLIEVGAAAVGTTAKTPVSFPAALYDSFPRATASGAVAVQAAGSADVLRLAGGTARAADTWPDLVYAFGGSVPRIYTVGRETVASFGAGGRLFVAGTVVKRSDRPELYMVDSDSNLVYIDRWTSLTSLGKGTSFRTVIPTALTGYQIVSVPLQPILQCSGTYRAGVGGQVRVLTPDGTSGALPATPLTTSCDRFPTGGTALTGPVFVKAPGDAVIYEVVNGGKRAMASWAALVARAGRGNPVYYEISASVLNAMANK